MTPTPITRAMREAASGAVAHSIPVSLPAKDVLALLGALEEAESDLKNVRVFVQDSLTRGWLDSGDVGNLMSARDCIDRSLDRIHTLSGEG